MRALGLALAVVVLAGCATVAKREAYDPPRYYSAGTTRPCHEYITWWERGSCIVFETSNNYLRDVQPGLDALGKLK
jgi:uncharacterized protein YceK